LDNYVIIVTSYKFILLYENVDMCQAVSPKDNYKNGRKVLWCRYSIYDPCRFKKCNLWPYRV